MSFNQRQVELERYFLSQYQRSVTFGGTSSFTVDSVQPKSAPVPTTSRVYWSPTRGHRTDQLEESETLDTAECESQIEKCKSAEKKIARLQLPHIPTVEAYRLVRHQLVGVWQNQPQQSDELLLKEFLSLGSVQHKPLVSRTEFDENGIVKIPNIPVKCEQYRRRRDSIERTARENWILAQETKDSLRLHTKKWSNLEITFDQQIAQTHELLSKRVKEVRGMCNIRCEAISILPSLSESQRQLVEDLTEKNSLEFREERKKIRTLIERFRNAARMALIMVHGFNDSRRRYLNANTVSKQPIKGSSSDVFVEVEYEKKAVITPGIAPELHMAFITQPENRSHKEITQILWVIRASKSFMDLFPDDMQYELARRVTYERYDEGRVLAYQNRTPDKFYFIISGKLSLLTEFQLNTGVVTRVVAEKTKGTHTDMEELEKQTRRENHLVAKGGVELLTLDREDYLYLTKLDEGLPIDFLRLVDIFTEFPVERFYDEPEAIQCKYYGRGQIIVEDTNRTPYIQVVKSGHIKVVRTQKILDINACNSYIQDAKKRPEDPLHTKTTVTTHADAMLGTQPFQRRTKTELENRERSKSTSPQRSPRNKSLSNFIMTPGTGSRRSHAQSSSVKNGAFSRLNKAVKPTKTMYDIHSLPSLLTLHEIKNPEYGDEKGDHRELSLSAKVKHTLPILINVPMKRVGEALRPIEKTWNGPDETIPQLPQIVHTRRDSGRDLPERSTVIQLDVLLAKDVFGLDHLHEAKFSEAKGVMLLSDGAEIISISKRFFQQNANNNTMLKLDTMFKEYLNSKETKEVLYRNSNWDQYRYNTLRDTLTRLRRKTCI